MADQQNIPITGIKLINDLVKTWTNKYLHKTTYQDFTALGHTFVTEFSLPHHQKPIPVATVKVFFYINPSEQEGDELNMKFRFENDSLIHKPDRTLRISKMEKWLEKFLDKKAQTSKVLFLGTQFESTRISHPYLDKINDDMNQQEEIKEDKYLSNDLLETPKELEEDEEFADEISQIQTMKTALFDVFRSVDEHDMGVLSVNEIKEVFQKMGLELTQDEWADLLKMADQENKGLIEYEKFINLGAEIIHGIFMKNSAEKQLEAREEEFLLQSILILHGSEIHDIIHIILEDIIKEDEDETKTIPIPKLKQHLIKHNEVLNESEIEEIIKIIKKKYEEEDFPYEELYTVLLDYKIKNLKNGLMESSLNKLELYIRSICATKDNNSGQLIHIDDLMKVLKQSDKIVLSKTQTYIIRSFMEKDENNQVNYITGSRILASMIKKFFTPDLLEKKAKLIEQGIIKEDQYMKGWSQEEIETDLRNLFRKIDKKGNDRIQMEQIKYLVKKNNLGLSEDELLEAFRQTNDLEEGYLTVDEFIKNFYPILKSFRCQAAIETLANI